MPRFDVTTYGEGGLRLSVPVGSRIETTNVFEVDVSATEANVLGALSRLGWRCGWFSALPATAPGRRVAHAFRVAGIDLSAVHWREQGRIGCYYVEYAEPPRATTVLYDRKDTCFAQLPLADVDWGYLLDTRHIHLTGLTYPLSDNTAAIIPAIVSRAREAGVTLSFDVNHRSLLWSVAECRERLLPLFRHIDLLFCSRRDAANVFGCEGSPEQAATQLLELSGAAEVVMSLSDDGVLAAGAAGIQRHAAHPVKVVDRIGAGDALAAGVLHGWLKGDLSTGLRYGTAMAALAMSQRGDMVITHAQELDALINGPAGQDIQR